MHCIIRTNCFKEQYKRDISRLIDAVTYIGDIDSAVLEDPELINSEFAKTLNQGDREYLLWAYEASSISSSVGVGEIVYVDECGQNENLDKIFSPREIYDYLREPLSVLVENDNNDGHFIKCLIKWFGNEIAKKALVANRIRMGNSGGCTNTLATIQERSTGFGGKPKFLRLYVIWDGDKDFPTMKQNKYEKSRKELNRYKVQYHILEKRAMENYMPDDALCDIADSCGSSDWYAAYATLSPQQKDFYKIHDGMTYSKVTRLYADRVNLDSGIQTLYSTVSEGNWNHLMNGLQLGNFKSEFPRFFESSCHVYKKSLLDRTRHQSNPNELQDIVDAITKLL